MIAYLIKFILCSGFLFSFYKLFLERESMYTVNRFYLLFALVFALIAPLYTVHIPISEAALAISPELLAYLAQNPPLIKEPSTAISWQNTIIGVYFLMGTFLVMQFLRNLWVLVFKIKKNDKVNAHEVVYVLEEEPQQPYSFLKYIFIEKRSFKTIHPNLIQHEKAHCIQRHSWDILFIELFQVLCWFNPFIYFYKKAIKLNHEFLADAYVLKNGIDLKTYQHQIVDCLALQSPSVMASNFNFILTKKRLLMMTKKTSKRKIGLLSVAAIPFLLSSFVLFGQKSFAKELQQKSHALEHLIAQPILPNLPKNSSLIEITEQREDTQPILNTSNNPLDKEVKTIKQPVVLLNEQHLIHDSLTKKLQEITKEQLSNYPTDLIKKINVEKKAGQRNSIVINDSLVYYVDQKHTPITTTKNKGIKSISIDRRTVNDMPIDNPVSVDLSDMKKNSIRIISKNTINEDPLTIEIVDGKKIFSMKSGTKLTTEMVSNLQPTTIKKQGIKGIGTTIVYTNVDTDKNNDERDVRKFTFKVTKANGTVVID